ncbi:MAG: hypothetical protein E6J90_44595 [Deltaproteobacteria bacterium]|nr:MAG: hypothetical protein E6J90_44595 [Deltaproteobacteria bacterium]
MKLHRSKPARGASLALFSVLAACGGRGGTTSAPAGSGSSPQDRPLTQSKDGQAGLELQLSSGKEGPPAFDRARLAPARPLSEAETAAVLQRLKPIAAQPDDQQSFALRARSQPPPRTGETIKSSFPPPASSLLPPPPATGGALRVLRYMPEGAVPLAPQLSVTFSQPMVAVTSQTDAAAATPVALSPQPRGRWRWIGTRTIVFDPEVRFPQATTYAVEVPAGTASASGDKLAQPVKFTFETPAPTMVSHVPAGSPQRLDVPVFVVFDQRIDPQAVLSHVSVKAAGKPRMVRLIDAAEIARDAQLAAMVDSARRAEQDGRWLAFRPTEDLPPDTVIDLEIGAGTPSAEGPNTTRQPQTFQFQTYPPLKIERSECGWRGECRPGMPFAIAFNNAIDTERFDDSLVTVAPAIPGLKVVAAGASLSLIGLTAARTQYRVVVSRSVTDEFGQTLGSDAALTWSVGDASPTFFGADGLVVLDPSAKQPTLDFFSTNFEQLKVELYAVTPADYDAYLLAMRDQWNHDRRPTLPGRKVFDQRVATGGGRNQLAETHVDLRPALAGGLGHAIAVVEPYPWNTKDSPPPRQISWVQSTRLGIDAHVDNDSLVAHAIRLDTGKGAAGVALELRPYGIAGTTDDRGMATLALGAAALKGAHVLVARLGDDVAFVAEGAYWSESGNWYRHPRGKELAWYVVDDRKLYKPGEEVSLKGWLRTIDQARNGDVDGLAGAVTSQPGRWLRHQVHRAEDAEPRLRPDLVRGAGQPARWLHPRHPDRGVPPARVRGLGAGRPGAVRRGRRRRRHGQREVLRRRSARRRAGALDGHRRVDQLHPAQPRRLRVRRVAAVVGRTRGRRPRRRRRVRATQATEDVEPRQQDRRDRRPHTAHGLPLGPPAAADGGDRERPGRRRQPPRPVSGGDRDRRRARRSTSTCSASTSTASP